MWSRGHNVPLLIVVTLLLTLLYPALFLGFRVAPEASLKSEAPWRAQWGRYPNPSPQAVVAATHLGPRLASIARDGMNVALWNPWIGGGRPGWLSSPAEGGAPLTLVAGLVARHGWSWTALTAMEIALAFAAAWWVLRALRLGPWPAAIGATAYALSGPVVGHWLDWRGSALALGPLALLPALAPPRARAHRIASWAGVLLLLLASGAPAVPFVALAAVITILSGPLFARPAMGVAPLVALVLVAAMAIPTLWLQRSGREPGAPAPPSQPGPRLHGLRALVVPAMSEEPSRQSPAPSPAYLGVATLLLAFLGVFRLPARTLGFWLGTLFACGVLAFAPDALLARLAISQRPLGVAALVVAVLAAHGTELLCDRVGAGGLQHAAGFAVWLVLVLALLPPAARGLPFAPPEEAELPAPLATGPQTATARIVAVLGMLPPDVSATLGLADVRAASLQDEPRYAALLGAGRDGELTVSRALDPQTARLGARWVLEPLALHVVSGELFAHIEVADLPQTVERSLDGLHRTRIEIPMGACRLGLPAFSNPIAVWVERPGHRSQLETDAALAPESDAWKWFALPPKWPAGTSTLLVSGEGKLGWARSAAWDTSGLRLVSEEHGTRVWELDRSRPLAFLATGLEREYGPTPTEDLVVTVPAGRLEALRPLVAGGSGRVQVAAATPARIELKVEAPRPALLVVQVKHRPALWKATVAGERVTTDRVDRVWTGVKVPAGTSHVVLRARIPLFALLPACVGLLTLGTLAFGRGQR